MSWYENGKQLYNIWQRSGECATQNKHKCKLNYREPDVLIREIRQALILISHAEKIALEVIRRKVWFGFR